MPYLAPSALKNLKKYAYRGVDEQVIPTSPLLSTHIAQVPHLAIRPLPVLELVHYSLATDGRSQHRTDR